MNKVILSLAILLLSSSTVLLAEQELTAESQQALKDFLAMDSKSKQSVIMEMLMMKKYDEARYLLAAWEKNAAAGEGPTDFLKGYVDTLVKSAGKQ